jgi:predicted aspartyl protease
MRTLLALALAVGALALISARADDRCRLERYASLEMGTDATGGATVPVGIGGRTVNLLVDTGGISSMLTDGTVDRLGLEREPLPAAANVVMYGGKRLTHSVTARDIVLGTLTSAKKRFVVLPDGRLPSKIDGTLAPDILAHVDVDFDFANAKLNLFSQDHCPGRVVYWTRDEIAKIPFELSSYGQIALHVRIDGKDVRAAFDTGTSRSVMSLERAEAMFGLKEDSPGMQPLDAPGVYRYAFKTLTFGGVTVGKPDIVLISDKYSRPVFGEPWLILGIGVMRQFHLFIAYSESRLYVSTAGAH